MIANNDAICASNSKTLTTFFKGIAMLAVVLVHSYQKFTLPVMVTLIPRFGQMGCQIFFVLSAFGLCHSFSKEQPSWKSFMKRRVSKLLVGYWFSIFVLAIYRVIVAAVNGEDIIASLNISGILINMLFLNGFVPFGGVNNSIVRGGWYVGTTMILYALFPILYKLYDSPNPKWRKYRKIAFPCITFLFAFLSIMAAGRVHPFFRCDNNTFVYYSFINQLTPFSLGLVLYDISKNKAHITKKTIIYSVGALIISIVIFFAEWKYSFVFAPSLVALSFLFMYAYVAANRGVVQRMEGNASGVVNLVKKFGQLSFPIYLSHTFVAHDLSSWAIKLLSRIYTNDLLWYIVLLPIQFVLVYWVGKLYNCCIIAIENRTTHKRKAVCQNEANNIC